MGARAGKYKFGARIGKHKVGARTGKHKLGARARTGGQAKCRGPGNTNTLRGTSGGDRKGYKNCNNVLVLASVL